MMRHSSRRAPPVERGACGCAAASAAAAAAAAATSQMVRSVLLDPAFLPASHAARRRRCHCVATALSASIAAVATLTILPFRPRVVFCPHSPGPALGASGSSSAAHGGGGTEGGSSEAARPPRKKRRTQRAKDRARRRTSSSGSDVDICRPLEKKGRLRRARTRVRSPASSSGSDDGVLRAAGGREHGVRGQVPGQGLPLTGLPPRGRRRLRRVLADSDYESGGASDKTSDDEGEMMGEEEGGDEQAVAPGEEGAVGGDDGEEEGNEGGDHNEEEGGGACSEAEEADDEAEEDEVEEDERSATVRCEAATFLRSLVNDQAVEGDGSGASAGEDGEEDEGDEENASDMNADEEIEEEAPVTFDREAEMREAEELRAATARRFGGSQIDLASGGGEDSSGAREIEVLHDGVWYFAHVDEQRGEEVHGHFEGGGKFCVCELHCRRRSQLVPGMYVEVLVSVVPKKGGGWRKTGQPDTWKWYDATLVSVLDGVCEVELHQYKGKSGARFYPLKAVRPSSLCEAFYNGAWYYGKVDTVDDDLRVRVEFANGEVGESYAPDRVRPMTPLVEGSAVQIDWNGQWDEDNRKDVRVSKVLAKGSGITYVVQVSVKAKRGKVTKWWERGVELKHLRLLPRTVRCPSRPHSLAPPRPASPLYSLV